MIIGVNCQHILETPAGPTYHLIELIKAIATQDKSNTYKLYFQTQPDQDFIQMLTEGRDNFKIVVLKKTLAWTQFDLMLELRKNKIDILFTSVHTFPILMPLSIKLVSMIHGFEFKSNKQYIGKPILYYIHPHLLKLLIIRSNEIVVPSDATKNALNIFTKGKYMKKVTTIPEGVNKMFKQYKQTDIKSVKQKYNISNKYIFFISTIQPRKNIPRMLEGFKNALENNPELENMEMVIAGKIGWDYKESLNSPKELGIEDKVKFIGHIDSYERPLLLSGAEFFMSCSLEEGFGLTLLEALACKTPALVSNIEAYKALGLDYARYVDPLDIDSIASGIKSMIIKPIDEATLNKGNIHAGNYTWEASANRTIKVFEEQFTKHTNM